MKRALLIVIVLVVAALWAGARWLRAIPEVRAFAAPGRTRWQPSGARRAGGGDDSVIPLPDTFHAMHVGTMNSDEVWSVVAPLFEYEWTAEPEKYVAEGPSFDNQDNLYFSPINPREDVSLIALDRLTGKRRWSIPGRGAGCGAPLILNDPEAPGRQTIFHSTYTTAMALRPDGSMLWSAPTGLRLPQRQAGERDLTHAWGMNYQPQADALFGVTMDGWVYAHDRRTGTPLLRAPWRLPGAPAVISARPPAWVCALADHETDTAFGRPADGLGLFTTIYDVIFGSGVNVANFYAIDSNSGSLYIAATALDEQDGAADGVSHNGALYRIELNGEQPGAYELRIVDTFTFEGGTGSTPTLSADGALVVVSDDNGNVIVLDRRLKERWRINVGSQVAASIAVSADNAELFAVTRYDIIKLIDHGGSGSIAWRATLDAYPGFANFNALTPTITANGILVSIGAGRRIGEQQLMSKFGMGLLDRDSGALRWFAEGREESIAVSAVGPDGAVYTAGSPVRRAFARAVFGAALPPLVGGIHRYRPRRYDLLVRDAACAAAGRAARWLATDSVDAASQRDDVAQIGILLRQASAALAPATQRGELTGERSGEIATSLAAARTSLATMQRGAAARHLEHVCTLFD
jgi:outer membrane protein assembly factor BamB